PSNWSDPSCVQEFPTTINFIGTDEGGEYASMKYFNISKPFDNLKLTTMPNSSIPATNV
ncbi:unnamed protein product, partial [Rotaria sordida]